MLTIFQGLLPILDMDSGVALIRQRSSAWKKEKSIALLEVVGG